MTVLNEVLVLPGVGLPLALEQRAMPRPGPGQALVRIEACGVCGSDLFLQKGGFGPEKLPVVPGHEAAGRVEAVGSAEDAALVGQQVALYYIDAPQDSRWAREGAINIGPDVTRMGVDVDGAFARYVTRPVSTLLPVTPEMDPAVVAVATDALATPFHALAAVARLQPGEQLLVIGPGGIGSNAVQIGALLGADVAVAGRSEAKLAQARSLGARIAVSSEIGVDALQALVGRNIDVVLECSGVDAMARFAVECAGYRARVVMVSASREPFPVSTGELIWREMSVQGSRGFTPGDIEAVLEHVRQGRLTTDHLTADQRPWRQANEALDDLREGRSTRTVLVMSDK
jgi:D-arabinose 1-dehydrogenase-like Zn-dependent alcohol dehydrogenase